MLTLSPEFVENSEYAFGVARIRALETRYLDEVTLNSLISSEGDRFFSLFLEVTGMRSGDETDYSRIIEELEESFTQTHKLVQSLILEDELRVLISLRYDYELLKFIVKEEKEEVVRIPVSLIERSRFGHGGLMSLLREGKQLETGEIMYRAYRYLVDQRETTSRAIDTVCDRAYYHELFWTLESCVNPFIRDYFIREIDAKNITTTLRLKLRGGKRADLRDRYLPGGSIDLAYLEDGFEMNTEGFAGRIQFSPFAGLLREVDRATDEEEQIAQIERAFDNAQMRYLRESMFVAFGVEPILAYLWIKEREMNNLRTILIAKGSGVAPEEIRKLMRGMYG
jgi:V/A-type H+-transporting ATPase subunit C